MAETLWTAIAWSGWVWAACILVAMLGHRAEAKAWRARAMDRVEKEGGHG